MPGNRHRARRARRGRAVLGALTTTALLGGIALTNGLAADAAPEAAGAQRTQNGITLLDTLTVPAGTTELGMPFGGLSGIDYDPKTHTYAALSDDRSENGKARFYTLRLPLKSKKFAHDKPALDALTILDDTTGDPFAAKAVDPEAIRWNPDGKGLLWTSEGASASGQPHVRP